MEAGKTIEVTIKDKTVSVRDYGRGIPLGKAHRRGFEDEYRRKIRFARLQEIRGSERGGNQGGECFVQLFPRGIGS